MSTDEATTPKQRRNSDENELTLYVWPGEWNLPSLDPECLTAMVSKLFMLGHFE